MTPSALSASARVVMVTMFAVATVVRYTQVRCTCGRRIMDVPGSPTVEVRAFSNKPSGRGRTLVCPRCKQRCEVIEHG